MAASDRMVAGLLAEAMLLKQQQHECGFIFILHQLESSTDTDSQADAVVSACL